MAGDIRESAARGASFWATMIVAATAPIFALLSGDHGAGTTGLKAASRFLSLPVLAAELVVVALAMAGARQAALAHVGALPKAYRWPLAILISLVVVSATFVKFDQIIAWTRSAGWLIHFAFALAVFTLLRAHPRSSSATWLPILGGLALYVAILVVYAASVPADVDFNWMFFKLGVTNVRQVGFYSAVGMTASLGLAMGAKDARSCILAIAAGALLASISFWSGTRSSLVVAIGAFALCAVVAPRCRPIRGATFLAAILAGGLLLSMLGNKPHWAFGWERLFNPAATASGDTVTSGRMDMWRETLALAMQRPLFGHGESQFRNGVPIALKQLNHPHNSVVQMLFQWGLIGAGCFFGLLAAAWFTACARFRAAPPDHLPAFLTANALLMFSLIEGALYHPYPVMMLFFALAAILARPRPRRTPTA